MLPAILASFYIPVVDRVFGTLSAATVTDMKSTGDSLPDETSANQPVERLGTVCLIFYRVFGRKWCLPFVQRNDQYKNKEIHLA